MPRPRDGPAGAVTVTASPDYDDALSALRGHVDDFGAWLGIWENRSEPDGHARRCAGDAVGAIDTVLTELQGVRARLVGRDPCPQRRWQQR